METGSDIIKYKRLTRSGARSGFAAAFQTRTSLWLGPDHLLSVESTGYTENYKRFYFRDIQAIVVQGTRNYQALTGILSIFAVILILVTFFSMPNYPFAIFFGILAGVFLMFLSLNLIGGPTCKTFLRTAVQIEQLPPLGRVRKTRTVLKKIHPLIVAAQGGELSPEAISAGLREWSEPSSQPTASGTVEDDPNVPPRLMP
ncbi:MAG TPA: hypothetical protein VH280_22375 [Verrucomicrobiae bacterium]|jgi:hypothetical protein|nr:hypothetical protein [Verrucomicrobiae bacterium]